jgi:hypothetical protein
MAITDSYLQLPATPAPTYKLVHRRRNPSTARLAIGTTAAVAFIAAGAYSLSQPATPAQSKAIPAVSSLEMADRVVPTSALPGFIATQQPAVARSAQAWASKVELATNASSETARLSGLGYVAGIREQLHGIYPKAAEAVSVTEQFSSAKGAQAELAYRYDKLVHSTGAKPTTFAVGIPSARGVTVAGAGNVGQNVMFAVGPYYYEVGMGSPSGANLASSRAQLVSAAGFLYLEVNGCVAPISRPGAD